MLSQCAFVCKQKNSEKLIAVTSGIKASVVKFLEATSPSVDQMESLKAKFDDFVTNNIKIRFSDIVTDIVTITTP